MIHIKRKENFSWKKSAEYERIGLATFFLYREYMSTKPEPLSSGLWNLDTNKNICNEQNQYTHNNDINLPPF